MRTETGDGWAAGGVHGLGHGPGFRKVRSALAVTAFGADAVVMPPGYAGHEHYHERRQELYVGRDGRVPE